MSIALAAVFLVSSVARVTVASEPHAFKIKTITEVLREPLPSEDLKLSDDTNDWVIRGATFTYRVLKKSGAVNGFRVFAGDLELVTGKKPFRLQIDGCQLGSEAKGESKVISLGKGKVAVRTRGILRRPHRQEVELDYVLTHTFFNDGVLVSCVSLKPRQDLSVRERIVYGLEAEGDFSHWLHKRRDEHGGDAVRGSLPEVGGSVSFGTPTSCLQVFSARAGLAVFTDSGATYLSRSGLDTAHIEVLETEGQRSRVTLAQNIVNVASGDQPFLLKRGEEFRFRVGMSLIPNRTAHRRMRDLRMFAWIGDPKFPYPSDEEIGEVARAGYTLFQMHRLGTPGEPRPPAGELERVIRKVHETGMLFLWTENADLMYDSAPGVQELKAKGKWELWRGFNYGGRYRASMDPYCDLAATCLASPNGLAEYRLETYRRMMQRFEVDGMYVDDNLAYGNCTLWREHGHPQPVYDSLIELHEMNWRRREFLRQKCPHAVLVSHNTQALVSPVVCDYDALLYGEGYSFNSLENYWDYYRPANAIPAQGMIWPGGEDAVRCPAALAYNYDLLTGGGQYCEIDWRWFPGKFSYAKGVTDTERLYVQTYNLAQYYFGLYESRPHYFAEPTKPFRTTTPLTYATVYHNQVWNEWLIPVANMGRDPTNTALQIRAPEVLGLASQQRCHLLDTQLRQARRMAVADLNDALAAISIPGHSLQLLCLRPLPAGGAFHVWGGKRLAETWDLHKRRLTVKVHGPEGLRETLLIGSVDGVIVHEVRVAGKPEQFFCDATQQLVHGSVTFTSQPLALEVLCSAGGGKPLPNAAVPPTPLASTLARIPGSK